MQKNLLSVLALLAAPAFAQTCDLEGSISVSFEGKPEFRAASVLYGISQAEIDKLHARALKVVDTASKVQDRKSGDYSIEFDETRKCNGTVSKGQGVAGVMVQGVTLHGVNRIVREFEKQLGATTKDQEDRASKGKRRAFGKD